MINKATILRPKFANMADGTDADLVMHEITGNLGDGPTVGISGLIHGNEYTGAYIIMELYHYIMQTPFRGRILLLPVANARAFAVNERFSPIDWLNLNRLFPGDPEGWYSDILADAISREFLRKIDVHIDLHAGTDRPTVDYVYWLNDEKLSRSFGSKILFRAKTGCDGTVFSGTTKDVTLEERGIPAVVVELGGGTIDQLPYVKRGFEGVLNMLRTIGTLEDSPEPVRDDQVVVRGIQTFRPKQGGVLITEAPGLGENITGGDVLGKVVSPYTFEELEIIKNPVKKGIMILSHLTWNLVNPGDFGYMVGDLDI